MRYKVKARYISEREIEIEAETEADAEKLDGDIISEDETNFYLEEIVSVEEVD